MLSMNWKMPPAEDVVARAFGLLLLSRPAILRIMLALTPVEAARAWWPRRPVRAGSFL